MAQKLTISHWMPFPAVFFVILIAIYVFGRLTLNRSAGRQLQRWKRRHLETRSEALATRHSGRKDHAKENEDHFHLEKRAFFSKTWLFVCHGSLFNSTGDYRAFDFAGIPFFIVLGKDNQLRAFHNVCRHRAFTVVRRSCGTSTRFSCKYHGWQYDDQGRLVKAPSFEESPNFGFSENGLFKVKLIVTNEDLVFVSLDANSMSMPSVKVNSNVQLAKLTHIGSGSVKIALNWKAIATDFSETADRACGGSGWLSQWRKERTVKLVGPMGLLKELEDGMWCSMNIWPESSELSEVKYELFAEEGVVVPYVSIEKWKVRLDDEIAGKGKAQPVHHSRSFSYQCGGRTIDLRAILDQQERSEKMARKKSQPNLKFTGTQAIDFEAESICNALEARANNMPKSSCSNVSPGYAERLEW